MMSEVNRILKRLLRSQILIRFIPSIRHSGRIHRIWKRARLRRGAVEAMLDNHREAVEAARQSHHAAGSGSLVEEVGDEGRGILLAGVEVDDRAARFVVGCVGPVATGGEGQDVSYCFGVRSLRLEEGSCATHLPAREGPGVGVVVVVYGDLEGVGWVVCYVDGDFFSLAEIGREARSLEEGSGCL